MPRSALRRSLLASGACALALLWTTPGRGAAPVSQAPSPLALSAILSTTPRVPRDLYDLARRLKLHTLTPIAPLVNPTPTDYPVGRVDRFFVAASSGDVPITATLALKTAHAYFYVQQGQQYDAAALARSAASFERHSYPLDRATFGSEWVPGVDNDRHITIFNGHLASGGEEGYVYGEDLYPRAVFPYSNQRKILFMDLALTDLGTSHYDAVLAHEFQHLIRAHLHPMDDAWINEGSSVLAERLNGYPPGLDGDKARNPDTQLNSYDPANFAPYYGGGYLWMLYLYEHYGGTRFTTTEMADSGLSNMALFDDVLARLGAHASATDVFADWIVANFLNDRTIAGGRYGYTRSSVRSSPTSAVTLPFTQTATMHQYGANYIEVGGVRGAAFTLRFAGAPTVALLETRAPAGGFWWSNRGDSTDDTLTAAVDLRGVRRATLRYALWYDLERDYDYGYVEVSDDGGRTWYAQRTARTTATNPNGTNLAQGYTGSSCSAATRARGCWVDEAVDLSAHAGRRVLLRFEQVTDDEVNGAGIAVAGVRVPEVGWSGDGAGGWQAAGWVRAGNALAERWLVRAIVYRPGGVAVLPLAVGADGAGSLRVPAGASRVVVAVAPAAPLTTVPAPYSLSGTP